MGADTFACTCACFELDPRTFPKRAPGNRVADLPVVTPSLSKSLSTGMSTCSQRQVACMHMAKALKQRWRDTLLVPALAPVQPRFT